MATASGATINFSGTYLDGNATYAIVAGDLMVMQYPLQELDLTWLQTLILPTFL